MSKLSQLLMQANAEGLSAQRIEDRARERGAKLSHGTAHKYMKGDHPQDPDREILKAFTVVFPSLSLETLARAADLPIERGPYMPPDEANALDDTERAALSLIIKSMAAGKRPSATVSKLSDRLRTVTEAELEDEPSAANPPREDDDMEGDAPDGVNT